MGLECLIWMGWRGRGWCLFEGEVVGRKGMGEEGEMRNGAFGFGRCGG